jgi:uncharacterized membrane protein
VVHSAVWRHILLFGPYSVCVCVCVCVWHWSESVSESDSDQCHSILLFGPYSVWVYVFVVLVGIRFRIWFRPVPHTRARTHARTHYEDQILIYAATPPNEPHQFILTQINNCNFKAQIVCSLMMVFHTEECRSFSNINFNANLKLFLRLSNCASVGEKYFDRKRC